MFRQNSLFVIVIFGYLAAMSLLMALEMRQMKSSGRVKYPGTTAGRIAIFVAGYFAPLLLMIIAIVKTFRALGALIDLLEAWFPERPRNNHRRLL